jgi:DegV family protein with EDD domain
MLEQDPSSDIAIVTDSTADIPADYAERQRIHIIPNIIIIDGKSLEDGVDITRQEFYEKLVSMKTVPTTATASSGVYQKLYDRLLKQGAKHILSIHASSLLSGIFNAAHIASQEYGDQVTVIDSQQLSLGLGFQVLEAARAVARGESVHAVLSFLEDVRRRIRLIAMLDTLEYVHRSGRVSWARARLGNLLRIKPFVEVKNGNVLSLGEARTYQKGLARLRELLLNQGPIEQLAILHTNAEEQARRFLSTLPLPLPEDPLLVNVTSVIGTHTGPNGIGFTVVKRR